MFCLAAHIFYFKPAVWERVRVRESERERERERERVCVYECVCECVCVCDGKYISGTQNVNRKRKKNGIYWIQKRKREKGKVWNGKSVPLYMASDIWLRTILIVRKETHCHHIGYSFTVIWLRTILILRKETRCRHVGYSYRLRARVLLYAPYHRQDNTYHGLCYTSRGALAGTRNSSMGSPHEGSIWRPIAPWANACTTELHLAPSRKIGLKYYHLNSFRLSECIQFIKCISSKRRKVWILF